MSGKQAKVQRKIARKQLNKEFGKDYALRLTDYAVVAWERTILTAPIKLRILYAWKVLRGEKNDEQNNRTNKE